MPVMQWNELLQEINATHMTAFELGERYATGEQGAFEEARKRVGGIERKVFCPQGRMAERESCH